MRLRGKFIAMQMSLQHYLVDQLETPTGIVEHAALRFNFFLKNIWESFIILKSTSFFYNYKFFRMNDTISISIPLTEFQDEEKL